MAYGQDTQYAPPQSFGTNLSPIIEAALQRKKQSAEQQAQMMQAIGKLASSFKQGSQQPSGPGPSDVSQPGYNMNDAVASTASSGDPSQLRVTAYGPSQGEFGRDETIGARNNILGPGDVAVTQDEKYRFPLGSHMHIGNDPQEYTVADFVNPRLHHRVDIWNGQDMGTQPVSGYAQGGVVPLPDNAEGVLGWRTWPDFNARATNQTAEQLSNPPAQHFASGGVASFTDPYGDRKSQYAEHLGPMADVSGIAGVISRQRMFQQEQQQQNISASMQAVNKLMQQRQSDEIANKLMSQLPSYGISTQGFEGQGAAGLSAVQQLYGLQQKQETGYNQAEDRVRKQYSQDLQDLNNEDKYVNHDEANSYVTTTDANGNTVRVPSGSRLGQEVIRGGSPSSQPSMAPTTMNVLIKRQQALQDLAASERAANMKAEKADVPFSRQDELNSLNQQLHTPQAGENTGKSAPITRQDLPSPNTAQPKQDAGSLKQEALEAIKRGADPEAVKARYKQLSGSDF